MSNRTRDTQIDTDQFSREITGLPKTHPPETVELGDGERFDLEIAPVAKRLGDVTVRMLAYNRSIPGPTLKVRQDSEVLVNVTNHGDLEATVHWHGVRVENRYDGTHQTQAPIEVGESFTYRVQFPDPGVYWYHPHIREDYGQELGLYGNIIVVPTEPEYWPPANRELPLTLDDVLLDEEGKVAPFSHHETTYVAMGRFGDVLLIGGETDLALRAQLGEVTRLFFTNTANTRVFKVGLPGARMKLVGGDSGRHEHEEFVDDVLLAPSERVVVDVLFEEAGELTLEHRTPERTYALASITVDRGAGRAVVRRGVRGSAYEPGAGGRAGADRSLPRGRAGQDSRPRRRDGPGWSGGGGRRRLRLSHASRDHRLLGRQVPKVRDEAVARRARDRSPDCLRLPHASRRRRPPGPRHAPSAE